ncbi:MAG: methanethiol S-methyltransferase [Planctomycetota bacterium]|jgi:protein-S-isoprenylcysteine O-methyltransferase Ste14
MKRALALVYGVVCYVFFLGVYLYLIGFVGNLLVPKAIDSPREGPLGTAILINVGLLALFGVQHTIMARPKFKRWWTGLVPSPIERSTYVLITNVILVLIFWLWRPMGGMVWDVETPIARGILWTLFGAGWLVVLLATFQINHFDLFGLRQVWLYFQGKEYTHIPFRVPIFYRRVRHPLYVGWIMAFWATPTMTIAHLVFAAGLTIHILVAIQFEERNLMQFFGKDYIEYRKRVPMLIPWRLRPDVPVPPETAPEGG